MSRKLAREDAFKLIFSFNDETDIDEMLKYYLSSIEEDKESWAQRNISESDIKYTSEVVKGTVEKRELLREIIAPYLKKWDISRIAKSDMAILLLAVYELKFREDIPDKVTINEAVELAKRYGDNDASKFINGILGAIIGEE